MKLNPKQARRFRELFSPLLEFANERLLVGFPLYDSKGMPIEEAKAATLEELWYQRDILDEFIHENPARLTDRDLATVDTWHSAVYSTFSLINRPDHHCYAVFGDWAFELCGIDREIDEMLPDEVNIVETALLPYEGRIVFGLSLAQVPVVVDDNLRNLLLDEFDKRMSSDKIVRSAEKFMRVAPDAAEEEFQRQIERDIQELEEDLAPDIASDGIHRGVLVGLSEQERAERIDAALSGFSSIGDMFRQTFSAGIDATVGGSFGSSLDELLSSLSAAFSMRAQYEDALLKGTPTRSFKEILMRHTKERLAEICRNLGIRGYSGLRKAELVDMMVACLTEDPTGITLSTDFRFADIYSTTVRDVREALAHGGSLVVTWDVLANHDDDAHLPLPHAPLLYTFAASDGYHLVVPDLVEEALGDIDLDLLEAQIEVMQAAEDYASASVELCGVAPLNDISSEIAHRHRADLHALGLTEEDIKMRLLSRTTSLGSQFYLLHIDDERWIVDHRLFHSFNGDEAGIASFADGINEAIERRVPSDEMLNTFGLTEYKLNQPAAIALRDFFDAHVPDGDSDIFFSTRMMVNLVDMSLGGYELKDYTSFLEANNLILNKHQSKKLIDLLTNFIDAMPTWENNGWSPNELFELTTGRKLFYNPDGSVMRLGDNDPCPCGSGLPYCLCHGA